MVYSWLHPIAIKSGSTAMHVIAPHVWSDKDLGGKIHRKQIPSTSTSALNSSLYPNGALVGHSGSRML